MNNSGLSAISEHVPGLLPALHLKYENGQLVGAGQLPTQAKYSNYDIIEQHSVAERTSTDGQLTTT